MRLGYAVTECTLCLHSQPARIHQRIITKLPTALRRNHEEPREEIDLDAYKGKGDNDINGSIGPG